MRAQQTKVSLTESSKSSSGASAGGSSAESLEEQCKCEVMQPGLYDIETEMCTPELDDAKEFIPTELQNNVLDKQPVGFGIEKSQRTFILLKGGKHTLIRNFLVRKQIS